MHHGDEDVTNVIGGCACGGNGEGLAAGASTENNVGCKVQQRQRPRVGYLVVSRADVGERITTAAQAPSSGRIFWRIRVVRKRRPATATTPDFER